MLAAGVGKGTGSTLTFSMLRKVFLGLMVDTEGFVVVFGCYYKKLIWFTLLEGNSFTALLEVTKHLFHHAFKLVLVRIPNACSCL